MIEESSKRPLQARAHYGWTVVGAVFVMLMCSSGFGFYNQSVLLRALAEERHFAVGLASFATTIFFAASGLTGLVVAVLIERFDARLSITIGTLIAAAALVAIGQVQKVWQLYLLFALFGVGFAGINMITGTTLITRWFETRRSLALALAATGLSVGGIVLTPIAARLIENLTLERATPWIALLLILGILPSLWLMRDDPAKMNLMPHGRGADLGAQSLLTNDATASITSKPESVHYRSAIRTRFFLCLTAAYFFGLMAQVGGIAHQFNLIGERAGGETAALAVSVLAASSTIGRLASGWLLQWVPMRATALILALAQGTTLLLLGRAEGSFALLLMSSLFGFTIGSFLLMRPLLLAEAFGVGHYSRIYSLNNVLTSAGVAGGPALLGLVHDQTGGYPAAYLTAAVASTAGALFLALAGPVDRSQMVLLEA